MQDDNQDSRFNLGVGVQGEGFGFRVLGFGVWGLGIRI